MTTTDDDGLGGRKRKLEEEYFRKQDQELIDKMRRAAAQAQARHDLQARTGIHDAEMLNALQELGFTPETVGLLPIVPLLQVAWAEGGISDAERRQVIALARTRGISEGSAADAQLDEWLSTRPREQVFAGAARLIHAMLDAGSAETHDLTADDLVKYCENIAAASGGVFGIGKVSTEERAALTAIASQLKSR